MIHTLAITKGKINNSIFTYNKKKGYKISKWKKKI